MHGRRRHLKILLHFGFGGRTSVDAGVGVDESQVLALLVV